MASKSEQIWDSDLVFGQQGPEKIIKLVKINK